MEKITTNNWPGNWDLVPAWTEISEEVYEHFLNVLPPLCWRGGYFQCSEPYCHEGGKGRYLTFIKKDGTYWFLGIQFYGQVPNPERMVQ